MSGHNLDREPYQDYANKYLQRILCTDHKTVLFTIQQLRSHKPKLLWRKRLGRCWLRLWTQERDEDELKGAVVYT